MSKFYNSTSARAQDDEAQFREVSPQQAAAHDLQARRLGQRFAFTKETARTYADLAYNARVRS
ncbi:hypothetical protein [Bradyrhizobium australiense]|uniref:Uncharacterized protein n=1 Tax=Bradyrhizobium australiense TaxID=2721161 RepID=A0A7Y4GQW5_9BRAD|nr:hypothetical protein [Bradyrhizobium australiense]NOJ40315.1 hypothetical protein [Bradyrhizobium australiense]